MQSTKEMKLPVKEPKKAITLYLDFFHIFRQDDVMVSNIDAPIKVVEVSKKGIVFLSSSVLPMGYYFKANINLGDDNTLHSVIKIINCISTASDMKIYRCEYVQMAKADMYTSVQKAI